MAKRELDKVLADVKRVTRLLDSVAAQAYSLNRMPQVICLAGEDRRIPYLQVSLAALAPVYTPPNPMHVHPIGAIYGTV